METMVYIKMVDGREIAEKFSVDDDVPRELINDLAFKEAYAKYQTTIKALSASFDWITEKEINERMEKPSADEMSLKEIFYEHYKRYDANPFVLLWFSSLAWIASRTTWKWKWNWEYYVSIPFWNMTRPIRKKLGIHHFSDDAEGDC